MNLLDVITEVGDALDSIDGLRVVRSPGDPLTPPAVIVPLPEEVDLEAAYQRGGAQMDLEVILALDMSTARTLPKRFSRFVSPGPASIKATVDGWPYTALDAATVRSVSFGSELTYQGVDYAAAVFTVHIFGSGTS